MHDYSSRNMIFWFFLFLFVVSICLIGWLLWPFTSIIVIALVVTGVFSPVYNRFTRKMNKPLSSFLTCILIFFSLFVPIVFLVTILSKEAYDIYLMGKNAEIGNQLRNLLENRNILEKINLILLNFKIQLTYEDLIKPISEFGTTFGLFVFDQARSIASHLLKFVVNFFLMLLIVFYMLMDGRRLTRFIVNLSPLPNDQDMTLVHKFNDMAGAILIGNGLGGLIQGVAGGMLFAFFGLSSPFLWGVLMGFLAFLPILGIGVVLVPASFFLFLKGRILSGLFFLIFYVVLSGGIEYIFKPKLVGTRVKMHTLIVFLAIIGGLNLFGILGIIYGPLIMTFFLTLTDIYHSKYQKIVEHAEF